ncbi:MULTISPECIES: metal ABC transporter solute-binding protein, Zn/Mn family [unclassified Methanoculleus]|jgi:zinc transport system substrate-binding protein|uniref:Zinc ABC transporter substrate-binding protein n=1 Tax=Methanoculleus palmolei TaxID=72612 RepID=A0ABD8A7S2_9EURY|nr:zinc ABC transporter substrate-binding protein [Methanoculleus sp. UBA377]MDD2472634.1 zinc ABC transporter substrate-binding protein [Methanoculleus sp.]WOX55585.1 zinc ABC transporter substrate-binding protein [Methanoculleus palmolei]
MKPQDKSKIISFSLVAAVFGILLMTAAMAGCTETDRQQDGQVVVAVTILPEQEFVERVGGDHVRVVLLVPPGADPHTYEPPPGVLADVAKADMYAAVGSGVEFELAWKDKIAAQNPDMLVVNCSRGIDMIATTEEHHHEEEEHEEEEHGEVEEEHHHHGGADPHVWVSPRNAKIMVENIREGLTEVDPEHADDYRRNADAYLAELDALDAEIADTLAGSGVTKIMVYHSAWAYFARDYGLTEIAIESEGKEPSPQRIAELVTQAREEHIKTIFVVPSHSSRSAEVIANEIGGTVVPVDLLEKDYLESMRRMTAKFVGNSSP